MTNIDWQFFKDAQGRWRWMMSIGAVERQISQRAFNHIIKCATDAMRHGFNPGLHEVSVDRSEHRYQQIGQRARRTDPP